MLNRESPEELFTEACGADAHSIMLGHTYVSARSSNCGEHFSKSKGGRHEDIRGGW